MKSLRGRTALITGGSAGIGLAIARALAREGMNLVLAARTQESLERSASELRSSGTRVLTFPTDVTDLEQLQSLVDSAFHEFGSIEVLVNNAGIESHRDFHQFTSNEIVQTVQVNLLATMQLTRLVLPNMFNAHCGHIVNVASIAGKGGHPFGAAYAASKAGQIAFTQSLRIEYFSEGISASVICPGFTTDGGMYQRLAAEVGFESPWFFGKTTCDAVAAATVKAILRDRPEVIVNSFPVRPLFALGQISPRFANWLLRLGTRHFFRKIAKTREQLEIVARDQQMTVTAAPDLSHMPHANEIDLQQVSHTKS